MLETNLMLYKHQMKIHATKTISLALAGLVSLSVLTLTAPSPSHAHYAGADECARRNN